MGRVLIPLGSALVGVGAFLGASFLAASLLDEERFLLRIVLSLGLREEDQARPGKDLEYLFSSVTRDFCSSG